MSLRLRTQSPTAAKTELKTGYLLTGFDASMKVSHRDIGSLKR
jgi:hypothetical protein